jgi:predicted PurR-regulated permease PerM
MTQRAPHPPKHPADRHLWQFQGVRDVLVLLCVFGVLWLGYKLSLVTVPMLLALLLAYLFEPLVALLTRRGWVGRTGAAIGIIAAFGLLVVLPVVVGAGFGLVQGAKYANRLSGTIDQTLASIDQPDDMALRNRLVAEGKHTWVRVRDYVVDQEIKRRREQAGRWGSDGPEYTPGEGPSDTYRVGRLAVEWMRDHAAEIGKRAVQGGAGAVNVAVTTFGTLGSVAFGAFLTAFFFFFFSTGFGRVIEFWRQLIPEKKQGRAIELIAMMDRVIAGFVRGRLIICACMMAVYSIGFWLVGVPAPLIVGPAVGLLCLVPYASTLVGIPLAVVLLALDRGTGMSGQWWWIVGMPLVVAGVAQFLDDYILTPRIQGKTTNLDTPAILFASIAGGTLAGVYGLLIAIPVAACLKILLREIFWPRVEKWSKGQARDVLPIEE